MRHRRLIRISGISPARRLSSVAAILALAVLGVSLPGCLVGPDYVRPESPMPDGAPPPDAWHQAAMGGFEEGQAPLQTWWTAFDDPTLTGLLDRARARNLDLQQAVARIDESRAILGIASGELYPRIEASADYQVGQVSEAATQIEGGTDTTGVLAMGAGLAWEIDVFGRARRGIESAEAGLQSSVEDYRDVMVSLFSEVAFAYIDVRTFQSRIGFATSNIEVQRESLQLTRDRFNAGLTSALDVSQAESNLADTEASIPPLEVSLEFALNRLAVLLAQPPGTLHDELGLEGTIPAPPDTVAVGLPADLVRQRPDIRRAERVLASQTAQIGVATADLYPRFSLAGLLTFDIAGPGDGSGLTWNVVPGLRWNIWDGDRIRSRIRVEEARTDQAFLAYEQTMLIALEDVENSLVAYAKVQERRQKLSEAVDATKRSVELVSTQYLAGLTDFQNVLDTQRTLFRLQDELAASEGVMVQSLIQVYRALGGGWDPNEVVPTRRSEPAQ